MTGWCLECCAAAGAERPDTIRFDTPDGVGGTWPRFARARHPAPTDSESPAVILLQGNIGQPGGQPVVADVNGEEYFTVGNKEHLDVTPEKKRWLSSVEEARTRVLTGPESPYQGR